MRTKAIISGAVALVALLFVFLFFTLARHQPQDITVRHVGSNRHENMTTMTFEVKNHSTHRYMFLPFEVQVRDGKNWSRFQRLDADTMIRNSKRVDPQGLVSFTVNVTNLPANSFVRFVIRPQRILGARDGFGLDGFIRRVQMRLEGTSISLNPYERGDVGGLPIEVSSDEFLEPERGK